MKHLTYLSMIALSAVIASCGSQQQRSQEDEKAGETPAIRKEFYGVMHTRDTITIGEPVELELKVFNRTDTVAKFLKWQTPYEPLLGKYLDVKDTEGNEASYIGAMAKRMMPPPAEAYITLNPGDSIKAKVDILKGYALEKPGKYTITFTSSELSGLKVDGPVTFFYKGK